MSAVERYDAVRKNRAYFKCLSKGHFSAQCRSNFICREQERGLAHHTLLHGAYLAGVSFYGSGLHAKTSNGVILLTQEIRLLNSANKCNHVNVWDVGSTLSFIAFHKARELKLQQQQKLRLQIEKVGGDVEEYNSYRYNLELVNKFGENVVLSLLGINKISSDIIGINTDVMCAKFVGITKKILDRPAEGEIDCLIGYNYAAFHAVKEKSNGHLLLLRNQFGFVIGGGHPSIAEKTNKVIRHGTVNRISGSVEDFYTFESMDVQCKPKCGSCKCGKCHPGGKEMSIQEEKEYEFIESNIHYDGDRKKWTASYPWVKNPEELQDNHRYALAAMKSCEKHLKRDEKLAVSYCEQMSDMLKMNVCRRIDTRELETYTGPKFYIAHQAVRQPDSKSTPLRIVFNSSADYNGHVLSDYYAKGPDMLNYLIGVLLCFREEYEAFHGDISKMFHSIEIPLADQMTHLFLWRNLEEQKNADTYAMTVVNFSDKPSGAIALVTLKKTDQMQEKQFPKACKVIDKNSYMNDLIDSTNTKGKALDLMEDIDEVLSTGEFKIKGWTSTISMTDLDVNASDANIDLVECDLGKEKVLGMIWNHDKDHIHFAKLNFSRRVQKYIWNPI